VHMARRRPAGGASRPGRRMAPGNACGGHCCANWMPRTSWHGRRPSWTVVSSRRKKGTGVGKTTVGKVSKVMVVADGHCLPIGLPVDSTRPHESQLAQTTLATVRVPQPRGRPRTRPQELVADKAYDSREFRRYLRRRGIKPTTPTFERRKRRKPKRGRPIKVGASYRQRWKVERCFGWMDNYRRLVVRYERSATHYEAFCLMAIILWSINLILKWLVAKLPHGATSFQPIVFSMFLLLLL
jgi:transposase